MDIVRRKLRCLSQKKTFARLLIIIFILQEDKDFDEVRDEESSDEEEGVEADTTMTLQGGVRHFTFGSCSFKA